MCVTIAATAVQITTTQIATAMAAEISDIVSSFTLFTLMILRSVRFVVVFRAVEPETTGSRAPAQPRLCDENDVLCQQLAEVLGQLRAVSRNPS